MDHWVSMVHHYLISFYPVLSQHLIVVVSAKRKNGGNEVLLFWGLVIWVFWVPHYNLVTGSGCCSMCKEGNGGSLNSFVFGFYVDELVRLDTAMVESGFELFLGCLSKFLFICWFSLLSVFSIRMWFCDSDC